MLKIINKEIKRLIEIPEKITIFYTESGEKEEQQRILKEDLESYTTTLLQAQIQEWEDKIITDYYENYDYDQLLKTLISKNKEIIKELENK